jgi:predicted nucleotidyltransferase
MVKEDTTAKKQVAEFVSKLRAAAETNLDSVVLYGSAAGGEFHPEFSDVNLLCVMRESSFAALVKIAPAVDWWARRKHDAPLVMTPAEMQQSADVFAIEFLDMKQRHRVLYGGDPLAKLEIPMRYHRAQVEYELREKVILLRERFLLARGKPARLWELLLQSLPAFTTLFRHALIALAETPGAGETIFRPRRAVVQSLAARTQVDLRAVLELLDVREGKADRKRMDAAKVFSRYLEAVQQVTAAVDTMLDSAGSGRQ